MLKLLTFIQKISILIIATSYQVFAQDNFDCATRITQEQVERMIQKENDFRVKSNARFNSELSPRPVFALSINILRNTDGTGGITEAAVRNELDVVNNHYRGSGLEFYIKSVKYINNSEYFNYYLIEEGALAGANDIPNTINIYFVNTLSIDNNNGTACGYTYLPTVGPDRIILRNDCAVNGSTFAHELGHFFGLIHTHGNGNRTDELVNGANCETAGDLVCDTPADPTLDNLNVTENCIYIGTTRDTNFMSFMPDVKNIMSYSRANCRDRFTAGQFERAYSSYQIHRGYIELKPTRAGFNVAEKQVCRGNSVSFIDISTNATSWNWTFQGGTPSSSSQRYPTVTYNTSGTYSVTLSVSNSTTGLTDSYTQTNFISVKPSISATSSVHETFETGDLIGRLYNEDGLNTFEIINNIGFSSNRSIGLQMFNSTHNNTIDRFQSKGFNAPNLGKYLLQFDYAYKHRSGYEDQLNIFYSNHCKVRERHQIFSKKGAELSQSINLETNFIPQQLDWIQEGVFFDILENDIYTLDFDVVSQGGNNIFFDNIKIRKVKPLDEDSLALLSFYNATGQIIPWNIRESISSWQGLVIKDGRVSEIDLSYLGLDIDLDVSLDALSKLKVLNLSGNNITLTDNFLQSSSLEIINLSNCKIVNLATNWGGLKNLKSLDLSHNNIKVIGLGLFDHNVLEVLNLRDNEIINFNGNSFNSSALRVLDLSYNLLKEVPLFNQTDYPDLINLTSNYLTFKSFQAISLPNINSYILSPQSLFGDERVIVASINELISFPSPIIKDIPNISLRWYLNDQLFSTYNDQTNVTLQNSINSQGYYQAKATHPDFPDVVLLGNPIKVNTALSSCDFNLSGDYQVITTGVRKNGNTINETKYLNLQAVDPFIYFTPDISGGVSEKYNNSSPVPTKLHYQCGQLAIERTQNVGFYITKSSFDFSTSNFSISWINAIGDIATSTYTLVSPGLSNKGELLTYSLPIQVGVSSFDRYNRKVTVTLGCLEGSPPPIFTVTDGTKAYIDDVLQISGESLLSPESTFHYKILAEDGIHFTTWEVFFNQSPRKISANFNIIPQSICNDPDGGAELSSLMLNDFPTNYNPSDYKIEWSTNSNMSNIISLDDNISSKVFGTYFARITEIASGCRSQLYSIVIEDNTRPASVTVSVDNPDQSCSSNGLPNGSLISTISNSDDEFSISWTKNNVQEPFSTAAEINGLQSGIYKFQAINTITGCEYNRSLNLPSVPEKISLSFSISEQTICASPNGNIVINEIRSGSRILSDYNGYTIQWSSDADFQNIIGNSMTLENLISDTYFLRVLNETLGCESPIYTIFVPANTLSTPINLSLIQNNTNCLVGKENGIIEISMGANNFDYSFQWYKGNSTAGILVGNERTLRNRGGGTYIAKVTSNSGTDAGCFSTFTTAINDIPNQIEINVASTPVTSCVTPNASAQIGELRINGVSQIVGSIYKVAWSTTPNFSNVISNSISISGLIAGTYYAQVTDIISGCKSTVKAVVIDENFPILDPSITSSPNFNCSGMPNGLASISNINPIGAFSFDWYRGDSTGGQSIAATSSIMNLGRDIYTVKITHIGSGCFIDRSFIIEDDLAKPSILTSNLSPQTSCSSPNGSIEITSVMERGTATQNLGAYTIQWSSSPNFNNILSSGPKLTNREAGTYYARVTRLSTGCISDVRSFQIGADLKFPIVSLDKVIKTRPALEMPGTLSINVEFEGEYSIKWHSGNSATGFALSTDTFLTNLNGGFYTVSIIADPAFGGCITNATFNMEVDRRQKQKISFQLPELVYFLDPPLLLEATSNGDMPISYEIISGEGEIFENSLANLSPGVIEIRAFNDGDESYFAADTTVSVFVEGNYNLAIKITNDENLTSTRNAILYNLVGEEMARSSFDGESLVITDIKRGEYFIKIPNSLTGDNYFIYYYDSKILFNEAEVFSLKSDTTINVDLIKREDNNVSNIGRINGILLKDQSQSRIIVNQLTQIGSALRSTDLILFNQLGEPIGMATSDENGQFSFVGIAPGLYTIALDVFGLEFNARSILLEVKENKPLNISIIVGQNGDAVIKEVITSFTALEKFGVKVFPNPVREKLTIDLGTNFNQIESIQIFNISGLEIQSIKTNNSNKLVELDVSRLSSGVYMLLINGKAGNFMQKLIKE